MRSALLLSFSLLVGCGFETTSKALDAGPSSDIDQEGYRNGVVALETKRTRFLGERAGYLRATNNVLTWLEFDGLTPTVHSWNDDTKKRTDYAFTVGSGDLFNYGASESLIVTAARVGDKVSYAAYRVGSSNLKVGAIELPAPTDEQRWWAYAVDGEDVYVLTTGSGLVLHKWTPASGGAPTPSTLGVPAKIVRDIGVARGRAVLLESGRLWAIDLAKKTEKWIETDTEVSSSLSFDELGVAFATASGGFFYYRFATAERIDLGAALRSSSYRVARGYDGAHLFQSAPSLAGSKVAYQASNGIFEIDVNTRDVRPRALDPIYEPGSLRVTYRDPQLLANGALFTTALESKSGSVGADGPVYRFAP